VLSMKLVILIADELRSSFKLLTDPYNATPDGLV